ncbi:transmembrane and TPR repeat-containing protein 2 [Tetranychus urticae]|uniref:transmembrane and TPR repeat-containing protein 2 n=1 Tax=Tetranychus urticae TaxID=32264 RepID=UPI00077B9876|nr:transmembrane and TPR repeat-containing protein 2 [Tetranychus urticae]
MCKNNRTVRIKSGLTNRPPSGIDSASSLNCLCSSSTAQPMDCSYHPHPYHNKHHTLDPNRLTQAQPKGNTLLHRKLPNKRFNRQLCESLLLTNGVKSTNCDLQLESSLTTLNLKHYGLIFLFSTLLYINTIDADFAYDDSRAIKTNQDVHMETPWTNLFYNDFWGTPLTHSGSHKSYRPLTVLTFRLNYYWHQLNPSGYHWVNVILHSLVSLLFAHLTTFIFPHDTASCLTSSLLFSSHPIHTEAVAGIVGRADLLAALFFTFSLITYIRYCYLADHINQPTIVSSPKWTKSLVNHSSHFYLYTSLITAACSMLSKEYGITVLAVSALYHIAIHHKLASHHTIKNLSTLLTEAKYSGLREGLFHLIASAILLITFRLYIMGLSTPHFSPADNPAAESSSFFTRTFTFLYLPVINFNLLLYPRWLSFDWSMESIPLVKHATDSRNLISILFYSFCALFTLKLYKHQSQWADFQSTLSSHQGSSSSHETDSVNNANYPFAQSKFYGKSKMRFPSKNQINSDHWLTQSCETDHYVNSEFRCSSDWPLFANGSNDGNNPVPRPSSSSSSSSSSCSANDFDGNPFDSKLIMMISSSSKLNSIPSSIPSSSSSSSSSSCSSQYHHRSSHSTSIDCLTISWSLLIIPFIPATNLLFYVGFVVAERILVIPSMGFSLLITLGFNYLLKHLTIRYSINRKYLYSILALLIVTFSLRTVQRNKDWNSEEDLYRSGIPINPPKAYGNLGNILSNKGNKVDAEMAYRKALTYRSNMADVHYNLGILLQDQGRYHEALQSYTFAVKFRPRLALAYLNMGLVLTRLGRKSEAIKVYQHCTRLDGSGLKDPKTHESTKISAYFNLGQLYTDEGHHEEAIKVFKEAIQQMPAHYQAQSLFNMLGEVYYKLGRYPEAEKWYKQALTIKKDHVPAHLTYAKLLAKWNRPEEAKQWFLKAEMLAPNDSSVYQHYGQFLAEHGNFDEAADCLVKAAHLSPNDYEIVFGAANILRQAGRNQLAERYYKEAVRLRPNEVTSHMNLGAMLHVNGKLDEAESSYLTALKLKPDDQLTQSNLAKLRHLLSSRRSIGS